MTLPVQVPQVEYAEDGVSTSFPVPFRYRDPAHVYAERVAADDTVTALVAGVDYSLSAGDTASGGTLTVTAAAAAGVTLVIWRKTPLKSDGDYETTGAFQAQSHEDLLDEAAMRDQDQQLQLDRAPKVPRGESIATLPALAQRKGSLLGAASAIAYAAYDADGNPTVDTPDNFAAAAAAEADRAQTEADRAQANAGYAEEFNQGTAYATRAAGEAATTEGQFFRVPIGTTPETYTRYQRTALGSVEAAPLATTAELGAPDGANRLGFNQGAPFIQSRKALDKLREVGASIADTGAKGDGATDDAAAVQEIVDHFNLRGGDYHLPPGVFKLGAPIMQGANKPQRIVGRGRRGVYPGVYDPDVPSDLAVLMPVHSGRAAIQFTGGFAENSIEMIGVALATLETGAMPQAAFGWDTAENFKRNYTFMHCSVHGFESAFDLYRTSGGLIEMGILKVMFSTINRNKWIARSLDETQWNGFNFSHNEAGQNGYLPGEGGIDVQAHNAVVFDNIMEGMRDPIRLRGGMSGAFVVGNYLEAVIGTAAVHLDGLRGDYTVTGNSFLAIDPGQLNHRVLRSNCGPGEVQGPDWWNGVHKSPLPLVGNSNARADNILNPNIGTSTDGLLRMDGFDRGETYQRRPELLTVARQRVTVAGRELAPWNGRAMPVAEYTTAGAGGISHSYAIAGSSGQFVVMSWLFRREPDAGVATDPYISMAVNGVAGNGGRDYIAYNFDEHWRQGEWCLITSAIRLTGAMTSLDLTLFPYGVNPAAGRKTRHLRPYVYTTDSPSKIIPYVDDFIARSVTATPNVPGFEQGDILINAAVAAAGQAEFVKLAGADSNWVYA